MQKPASAVDAQTFAKNTCPECGEKLKVTRTLPESPDSACRIRYHKCPTCGKTIKSVEE